MRNDEKVSVLQNPSSPFQPVERDQMEQVLTIPFLGAAIGLMIIICEVVHKWRSTPKIK